MRQKGLSSIVISLYNFCLPQQNSNFCEVIVASDTLMSTSYVAGTEYSTCILSFKLQVKNLPKFTELRKREDWFLTPGDLTSESALLATSQYG